MCAALRWGEPSPWPFSVSLDVPLAPPARAHRASRESIALGASLHQPGSTARATNPGLSPASLRSIPSRDPVLRLLPMSVDC